MRIGFDARPLLGRRTGVGVWLEGWLAALVDATDWQFVAFFPRRADLQLAQVPSSRVLVSHPPLPLPGTLWLHTTAAAQVGGRVDVFVGTLAVLPRRLGVPAVSVVHDLTPRTLPQHHTLANRFCFNAYLEGSMLEASAVVCVSEATRIRLAEVVPGPGRGAAVIGPGVDPSFFAPPPFTAEEIRRRFAAGAPYILQLGTLEPRKGVATLLEAHGQSCARGPAGPHLVLAGEFGWGGNWLRRALARHPAPERVHLPGYVTREEARALLTYAEVVVVASDEEGFGLPLAEAMACGAACVASDAPALLEVAGGAARHFPRGDAVALAAALAEVTKPEQRRQWQERARARAQRWRWEQVVPAWQALLEEVVARSRVGVPGGLQVVGGNPRAGKPPR